MRSPACAQTSNSLREPSFQSMRMVNCSAGVADTMRMSGFHFVRASLGVEIDLYRFNPKAGALVLREVPVLLELLPAKRRPCLFLSHCGSVGEDSLAYGSSRFFAGVLHVPSRISDAGFPAASLLALSRCKQL